jgi:hypothetical protein
VNGWRLVDYLVLVVLLATTVILLVARVAARLDEPPTLLQGVGLLLVILLSMLFSLGFVLTLRRFRGDADGREGGDSRDRDQAGGS